MKNLLNPKWLFLINTLPILILFALFIGQYNIIKSLLENDNLMLWKTFGIILFLLGLLNFCYAAWTISRKQSVTIWYGIVSLICHIAFIYSFSYNADRIIPISIPGWMISGDKIVYVGTFLMPTLAYSLFVLVSHFTPETKEHKAWKSFLIALVIPISFYIFSQLLWPLWQPLEEYFTIHMIIVLLIIATLVFLFFLIRGLYILVSERIDAWKKYQLAWKIPISIIFPILGLAVNNGHLVEELNFNESGVFGDFNNKWFYILAVVNGIFICFPEIMNIRYRTLLYVFRSIFFSYTFYFFIVFLPYLPLSIFAITAIGVGFLMLTPLLLFVIHVSELSRDFSFLKQHHSDKLLWTFAMLSFLIIPFCINISYLKDKKILNNALNYIYTPDYSKEHDIDLTSLQKTIEEIKKHKDTNQELVFNNKIPYLSSYFNWLVLDNLTLSETKINTIEKIFFGANTHFFRAEDFQQNDKVKITQISNSSIYDSGQNAWLSWIDMEITNESLTNNFSEFSTVITLPEGCFISDYYLYVGKKKEMGILCEKKSALWVFSNIRNENKDPGILYYLKGNKVAFKIFPFAEKEVRKSGIQILHKEPVTIILGDKVVKLGSDKNSHSVVGYTDENLSYISTKDKNLLKPIRRKPYFHFLVDISKNQGLKVDETIKRIEYVIEKNKIFSHNSKISLINNKVKTFNLDNDWKQKLINSTFEGGFYIDRGIKVSLKNAYDSKRDDYPVLVAVSDSLQKAIFENDYSDFKMMFPETDLFLSLDKSGKLNTHSLTGQPQKILSDTTKFTFDYTVLEYLNDGKKFYLPNDNLPSIVLKNENLQISSNNIIEKNWKSALLLKGKWISNLIYPVDQQNDWLDLVKYSFKSRIMTPVTSYLVVENDAQKAILKKKQEQVLSGNKSLDLDEDTPRMSEPELILLLILFGFFFWYRKIYYNLYIK